MLANGEATIGGKTDENIEVRKPFKPHTLLLSMFPLATCIITSEVYTTHYSNPLVFILCLHNNSLYCSKVQVQFTSSADGMS